MYIIYILCVLVQYIKTFNRLFVLDVVLDGSVGLVRPLVALRLVAVVVRRHPVHEARSLMRDGARLRRRTLVPLHWHIVDDTPSGLVEGRRYESLIHRYRTYVQRQVYVHRLAVAVVRRSLSVHCAAVAHAADVHHLDVATGPLAIGRSRRTVLIVSRMPGDDFASLALVRSRLMIFVLVLFGRSVRNVHRHALNDVVLPAQALGHFGVEERDEAERSERLRYKHVGHLTELSEIVPQVVRRYAFGATAYEHLAGHFGHEPLFRVGYPHVAPPAVYEVSLCERFDLRFVIVELDEAEPFGRAGFGVAFDLHE